MTPIFLDIETLPANWSREDILANAAEHVPGNITKQETRERWIADNADELHRRTSLDPLHARILCIGLAVGDDVVRCAYSEDAGGADTVELLTWLEEMSRLAERPFWVGHNIAGFDLPILLRTAWKFRHPVAKLLPRVNRSELVYDTQERWKATDRYGKGVRLDALAEFLGLAGKLEGMAGSEVYPAWLRGEHERIQRYCRQDVELVRDVYCVMEGLHEPA